MGILNLLGRDDPSEGGGGGEVRTSKSELRCQLLHCGLRVLREPHELDGRGHVVFQRHVAVGPAVADGVDGERPFVAEEDHTTRGGGALDVAEELCGSNDAMMPHFYSQPRFCLPDEGLLHLPPDGALIHAQVLCNQPH